MSERRNISIQILRVIACLMVFIVHFGQRINLGGLLRNFTDFGQYGVQLFFLISGFLACKTFYNKKEVSVTEYYKKRMISVLPLYYFVIIYYFISENIINHYVYTIPQDELGIGWFRYLFLLNGFFNSGTYFWSNLGITWTIPIFMFFYLIAPFFLKRTKTPLHGALLWFVIFIITKTIRIHYTCTILTNIHFLFLGSLLYMCSNKKNYLFTTFIFLCGAIAITILNNDKYVYVCIFSCFILLSTLIEDIKLPKILEKTINILDRYSYTLYLMHGVVFCSLLDRLNRMGVSSLIVGTIAIVGTFLSTWIVGKYIEQPIQRYLKKRLLKTNK